MEHGNDKLDGRQGVIQKKKSIEIKRKMANADTLHEKYIKNCWHDCCCAGEMLASEKFARVKQHRIMKSSK